MSALAYVLIDRETGEEKVAADPSTRLCRPMRHFTVGAVSPDEWVTLDEVTVAVGAEQPWPVAARFNGQFRACDIDVRLTAAAEASLRGRACTHPRVIRGTCSDGCVESKAAPVPHHHGDPTNGFLAGSCRFCGAVLINRCESCRHLVGGSTW